MRPRTELAVGLSLLLLVGVGAVALGRRQQQAPSEDRRRSTYLSGPLGAKGFTDALELLGVQVERNRSRLAAIDELAGPDSAPPPLLVFLDPSMPLDAIEATDVVRFSQRGDLLLAGAASEAAMRCFGFAVEPRYDDSTQAVPPDAARTIRSPWVHAVLAQTTDTMLADSSDTEAATVARCRVRRFAAVDTLLVSSVGRVVALRLQGATERGGSVTLVADGSLFSNRVLRQTDAGVFLVGDVAARYRRVIVDERHHGFGPGGSLGSALLAWSQRSPWGWAAWQLAVVGLVAMFAGAVRFGPPVSVIQRKRRSPLEHVRALATALAAARGHDVAVGAMVRGLRRRLSPAGHQQRGDWRSWLAQLPEHLRTPRARDAAGILNRLTQPGQPVEGVLRAANAVEDVWEELRP